MTTVGREPQEPLQLAIACGDRVPALRAEFAAKRRVQIRDFLDAASADAIYACLAQQRQWNLVFTVNGKHTAASTTAVANWPVEKRRKLEKAIHGGAQQGFQYYYAAVPLYDLYHEKALPGHFFNNVFEFLNSSELLELVRAITGEAGIGFADAQATRYGPGHFLTCHDDNVADKNRRIAYVLGLTPLWRPDWGGLLQFFDREGNVAEAYTPRYNALSLFRVPMDHSVAIVAPFTGALRYSVTGWFRSGSDPLR